MQCLGRVVGSLHDVRLRANRTRRTSSRGPGLLDHREGAFSHQAESGRIVAKHRDHVPARRQVRDREGDGEAASYTGIHAGKQSLRVDADLLLRGEFQDVGPWEWLMYKPRWGAFHRTRLEEHIRRLGVDTLVIAGCNFPNSPRTTIWKPVSATSASCSFAMPHPACTNAA